MDKKFDSYYNYERREVAAYVPSGVKTILDVGCGHAKFLGHIKAVYSAETWGVEAVQEIADSVRKEGGVDHLFCGKIEDTLASLPDNYFDCITFNDVLEHLLEPGKVLDSMKGKLSANGVIVASIPNVRYLDNIYNLIVRKDWKYEERGILDSTHLRFFTRKSMIRLFELNGYGVVSICGINRTSRRMLFNVFNCLTLGYFNDMQYLQFVVVARKLPRS